ncbi:hypothetical protein VO54_03848 [Elizabethkingia miricola]|nr:hypothetical protein VO54_03848 [Elizabethkingia miricola]
MKALFIFSLCLSFTGYAQKQNSESPIKQQFPKTHMMDLSKITNKQVKNAIEALQSGDTKWYSYFTENPEMTDDGHRIEFKSFFAKALGNEKFLSIDKVEDDGKTLYGNFKAGQWGTFRVFFKFHQNATGKFERLDIGQAN